MPKGTLGFNSFVSTSHSKSSKESTDLMVFLFQFFCINKSFKVWVAVLKNRLTRVSILLYQQVIQSGKSWYYINTRRFQFFCINKSFKDRKWMDRFGWQKSFNSFVSTSHSKAGGYGFPKKVVESFNSFVPTSHSKIRTGLQQRFVKSFNSFVSTSHSKDYLI